MNKVKLKVFNIKYVMICLLFTIICILTSFFISSNSNVFKSYYINQLLGTNSTKGLMYMMAVKIVILPKNFIKKRTSVLESFYFHFLQILM